MLSLAVVIPTHNREQHLRRAIASALSEAVEVVVVDDASDDGTQDLVHSFGPRSFNYVRLGTNRGPGHARNVGVKHVRSELILFLDDDDEMLPGSREVIEAVSRRHPDVDLYLHNCVHSDGSSSIPISDSSRVCAYQEWLNSSFSLELKPVTTRSLFDCHRYEDTNSGAEHLLWMRVIRERGAVVSAKPVVRYNDVGLDRLTSAPETLKRVKENAHIADLLLLEFGQDLRELSPRIWVDRTLAAAMYAVLTGQRVRAHALLRTLPRRLLPVNQAAGLIVASFLPNAVVRVLFLAYRRELVATVRSGRLTESVRPREA